jgi:hypothetical protein
MSQVTAILLAVFLALGPSLAIAGGDCECVPRSADRFGSESSMPECCGPGPEDDGPAPEQPVDERPCDATECSLMCCGVAKSLAAPQRSAGERVVEAQEASSPALDARRDSPHLLELKRPPRTMTHA